MKLAIVTPSKDSLTETFIQAHIEHMKGEKLVYHGGKIPTHLNGTPLIHSRSILRRALAKTGLHGSKDFPVFLEAFYNSLLQNRPNVVLAEYGPTGASILPAVKKANIPLIVHFHGYDASQYSVLEKFQKRYLELFDYASQIIAVSQVMKNGLIELGAKPEKITTSLYGPHPLFELKPNHQPENQFLAVGRLVDKKAPHLTILAFSKVVKQYPEAKLKIIGDGPLLEVCKDLASGLNLNDNLTFLGAQPREVIMAEMSRSACFVQHSKRPYSGDMEGTPVAIIESQMFGLPVVSTIHAGIPEIVVHGETGYLVAEGDLDGMAHYMMQILASKEQRLKMGVQARNRALTNFTMKHHIDCLDAVVENAMQK